MKIVQIAVVPGEARVTDVSDSGTVDIPIRRAGRFDDFAEVLRARLGVDGRVWEMSGPMPGAGTVVICRPDVLFELDQADADMSWVVGVDLLRSRVIAETVRLGLAAAVETLDFDSWVRGSPSADAAIYGRAEVGAAFGAVVSTDRAHSGGGYARISHPEYADLSSLLAAYLLAYCRQR